MDTPTTKTIKVTFPNNIIKDVEIAIYYGTLNCGLIILCDDRIYKKIYSRFEKQHLEVMFENLNNGTYYCSYEYYCHNSHCSNSVFYDYFMIKQPSNYICICLGYDPDEDAEFGSYFREHGLFGRTNEWLLK